MSPATPQVRVALAAIRESALSVDEVLAAVSRPDAGGVACFVGVVRDHDHGREVAALGYSAHPTAATELQRVCQEVADAHPEAYLAAVHRVGDLQIGDLAVVVAAAAAHRGDAFAACRALIDTLKAQVPIWKHQQFVGGDDEWVGLP